MTSDLYKAVGNLTAKVKNLEIEKVNHSHALIELSTDVQVLKDLVTTAEGWFSAWKMMLAIIVGVGSAASGLIYFLKDMGYF